MNRPAFVCGLERLLARHGAWLRGRRIGIVTHAAAVDARGAPAVLRLRDAPGVRAVWAAGPEHGFWGAAGAGATVDDAARDDLLDLPVYTLYGARRAPDAAMLADVDAVVFDMQDIGARAYTYVSTLAAVARACAAAGKTLIVADRPVPLPGLADGPIAESAHASFVALPGLPLAYGLTPGGAARWLCRAEALRLGSRLDLRVAACAPARRADATPPWLPPSPALLSWESAACFPATVLLEAFPAADHGRTTGLPFQVFGHPDVAARALIERLAAARLLGVRFDAHRYHRRPRAPEPTTESAVMTGVRMTITDPERYRPALTGVAIVHALQGEYGVARWWKDAGARPDWFDKLMGTDRVRLALQAGLTPRAIAASWRAGLAAYRRQAFPA